MKKIRYLRSLRCNAKAIARGILRGVEIAPNRMAANSLILMVGVAGFEPATPASRTQCSTGLSHTPTRRRLIASGLAHRKRPS